MPNRKYTKIKIGKNGIKNKTKKISFLLKKMSSFSLHIEFSQVADVDAKYVARTWFFLILKPLKEVSELLLTLLQPQYKVKYVCFAEEQTLENEAVTIGYLEFIQNRGLSGIKSYPGLDMAIIGQRKIAVIKPDQAVSFVKGNYQMTPEAFKPLNQHFWASSEQRAGQRGRKMKIKEIEAKEKEIESTPLLYTKLQPQEWLTKLLELRPIVLKSEKLGE